MFSEHNQQTNNAAAEPRQTNQNPHNAVAAEPENADQPAPDQPLFEEDEHLPPDPDPSDPRDRDLLDKVDPERRKRNCGRTGPKTNVGRAIAARNATRHGMCSRTLILVQESEEDWHELITHWLSGYGNPAENTLLYTFVLKTTQAEWFRMRANREYDFMFQCMDYVPMQSWSPEKHKEHDLVMRYVTAAERKVQREYRMLEHHFKTHHKADAEARDRASKPAPAPAQQPAPAPDPDPQPDDDPTKIFFVHSETGERRDAQGNKYPPRPDFKPEPIIPGKYPPNHPASWGERQRKR